MKKLALLAAVSAAALSTPAHAGPILTDLPNSTYITVGNLDWTWASPVSSATYFTYNVLSAPTLHAGWRFATVEEFEDRPNASAFRRHDGTVINSAVYWNSSFDYVDYTDGVAGYLSRVLQDTIDYRDIWYVRDAISAVPEPAAWALMIGGFGVVGAGMRQRRKPSPSVRFA